jgi:hypothetical protein
MNRVDLRLYIFIYREVRPRQNEFKKKQIRTRFKNDLAKLD